MSEREIIEYILKAIHAYTGDDLERARMSFIQFTPRQMQEQHGQSGRTRQEVLDGYVRERALATTSVHWVTERTDVR